jgi:hypothetical protein
VADLDITYSDCLIAFLHIYKCGGTTFNWVLQRAFPERVLYCENKPPEIRHIEKDQYDAFREKTKTSYSALSSHLIRYNALSDFDFVVTILRDPAKRLLSAFNYDVARGEYSGDLDSYIECRTNAMSWTLGKDFLSELDSGRIFCCILENLDLSMICLEYLLAIHGHEVDLAAPRALNVGKERIKDQSNMATVLTPDQLERIQILNQSDCQLYSSQLSRLKGFSMAIPGLTQKLNDYQLRKEKAVESIPKIRSYGQGPRHFTYI